MNHFQMLKSMVFLILEELEAAEKIPLGINRDKISVELPRERSHGDLSTNVALVLAKPTGFKPRELASLICEQLLNKEHIVSAKIAGPGFINVCFSNNFWRECLKNIIRSGSEYGSSEIGSGRIINVEYVSANPTGPLHVGHGRGAVVGDVLASLLDKTGFEVTKEYYINDAGGQIEVLARSLYFRYQEIHGVENGAISDDYYSGNYLVKVAKALQKRDGAKWLGMEVKDWLLPFEEFAVQSMMSLIKEDLKLLGVQHDVFTSERDVVASGIIDQVLSTLEKKNLLLKDVLERPKSKGASNWRERSQVLFKSTIFGDDTNRPIKKSDGSWTYFASDMAYHMDKYHRNFDDMINIWGADHGGYITRMKAAVEALTEGDGVLDVKICQLVNLVKDGNSIKMSKRNDSFVTLREVIEEGSTNEYIGLKKEDLGYVSDIFEEEFLGWENCYRYTEVLEIKDWIKEKSA